MSDEDRWYSCVYTLDDARWGFLAEHSEAGFYAYEKAGRRVVPSFHRFEHAALFVRQLEGQPELERGGSYDLAPAYAYARGALAERPEGLDDAWYFLLDVADAAELDGSLPAPSAGPEARAALLACFEAFLRALEHLDDARE